MAYQAGYAAVDTIVLVAEIRDSISAKPAGIIRGIAEFASGARSEGGRANHFIRQLLKRFVSSSFIETVEHWLLRAASDDC